MIPVIDPRFDWVGKIKKKKKHLGTLNWPIHLLRRLINGMERKIEV